APAGEGLALRPGSPYPRPSAHHSGLPPGCLRSPALAHCTAEGPQKPRKPPSGSSHMSTRSLISALLLLAAFTVSACTAFYVPTERDDRVQRCNTSEDCDDIDD